MGFFDKLFGKRKDNEEEADLPYEEYCENCGELLEDCECDEQDFSKEDISQELLNNYIDPDHQKHQEMVEEIRKRMHFDSLKYHRLDDLVEAIGLEKCKLCTYCFDGKEEND